MLTILDLIKVGESKWLEFKQDYSASMLKSVSAFANEHDGWILFGVSDQKQIVGMPDSQQLRLKIENAINDNIQPRPYYEIESQKFEGHELLVLKIFKGEYTPYYYHNKAYIRHDTSPVEADRIRLNQLILAGQNIQFDEAESPEQNLTFDNLERVMRQRMQIGSLNTDLLKTLNLIKKGKFTNAAAMLSDQNPVQHAALALLVYSLDRMNLIDRNLLEHQSVLAQFESCIQFFQKHSQVSEIIAGAYRQTVEEVPLVAYREAIANAIVHRDYQAGGQIKVEFWADRIEITSPGALPPGISRDEYLEGRISIPRNKTLADVFMRLGMIEKFATGIRRIKETYQARERKPEFLIGENSITVILPKAMDAKVPQIPENALVEGLTADEQKIVAIMNEDRQISRRDVSDLLSIGKTRAYQLLNGLIEKHIIYPVGSGKNTRYRKHRR